MRKIPQAMAQDPQAREQSVQHHGGGAVTLKLSFGAIELLVADATEASLTLYDTPSAAAGQQVQKR